MKKNMTIQNCIIRSGDSTPFVPTWERQRTLRPWMTDASFTSGTAPASPIPAASLSAARAIQVA